ncbi:MAG: hypothetical protein GC185_01590 [Alphaproteobacteria bacterium]|nr:hypothetical protein [Alphaproteobacteria bacterium]
MASQVYNFMWLNLDAAQPDPEDGSIRHPLPLKYLDNVRKAGKDNPGAEVVLWVDSKRLTQKQMDFLESTLEEDRPNVHLKDLRTIPAYDQEPLYNEVEKNPNWRNGGQTSLIWRQVDAAKVLVTLQGDFDQSFFADLDHAHLEINGKTVQKMLNDHGLMIGSYSDSDNVSIENQLWGFTARRREFFESYYETSLQCAYNGRNAWRDLVNKVDKEIVKGERVELKKFCLPIKDDGTRAEQPGHAFRDGRKEQDKPAVIEKGDLSRVFNARGARAGRRPCPQLDVTWGISGRNYAQVRAAQNKSEETLASIPPKNAFNATSNPFEDTPLNDNTPPVTPQTAGWFTKLKQTLKMGA